MEHFHGPQAPTVTPRQVDTKSALAARMCQRPHVPLPLLPPPRAPHPQTPGPLLFRPWINVPTSVGSLTPSDAIFLITPLLPSTQQPATSTQALGDSSPNCLSSCPLLILPLHVVSLPPPCVWPWLATVAMGPPGSPDFDPAHVLRPVHALTSSRTVTAGLQVPRGSLAQGTGGPPVPGTQELAGSGRPGPSLGYWT